MADAPFHLIDVASQWEALERFLREKSLQEKERWIASQGELTRVPLPNESFPVYRFISRAGLCGAFGIRGDEIVVFGDHSVLARKKN